ncbi:MAG: phosphate signaling complex protein PhoU [Planctomycetota bacterium]
MTTHFVNLLDELRRRSLRMAGLVEDMLQEACDAIFAGDEALATRVVARDQDVDTAEVQVESEVIRLLALYQPVGSDLRLLCTILKVNNDLERVADCTVNIGERVRHLSRAVGVPKNQYLKQLATLSRQVLRDSVQAYASENSEDASRVLSMDDAVDALYGQFVKDLVSQTPTTPDEMASQLDVLSIAKNLERIADHATNVAEDVIFLSTGKIVRHQASFRGKGP